MKKAGEKKWETVKSHTLDQIHHQTNVVIFTTLVANIILWPVEIVNIVIGKTFVSIAGGIFLILINYIWLQYRIKKSFSTWSSGFLIILGVVSIYIYREGGMDGAGHLWIFLFPIFAYEFKGYRTGSIFVAVYLTLSIAFYAVTTFLLEMPEDHTPIYMIVFFLVVIAVSVFLYFNEKRKNGIHEQLKQNKNKFEALFNDLSLGVIMLDRNLNILESNRTTKKWFPDFENHIHSRCYEAFHPENSGKPCLKCPVQQTFSDGLTHTIEQAKNTPSGKRIYRLVSNPMFDSQKYVYAVIETLEDITEQKEYQNEILKREATHRSLASRYEAFIEATNTGAWEFDHQLHKVWCSSQYFTMLGYNKNAFCSENVRLGLMEFDANAIWETLIHPDDLLQATAFLNLYINNPDGSYQQYFRMLHQNGSYRWILSRGKLLNTSNGSEKSVLIGTHIDITDQKQSEEALLAKNRELESYLYVASHDLRSPLVNIQGFTHRIQKLLSQVEEYIVMHEYLSKENHSVIQRILKEEFPRSFGFIHSNVNRMDSLIKGLLSISRTGRIRMNIVQLNVMQVLEKILHGIHFQIKEDDLELNIDALPSCFGDESLVIQLFTNLLENAVKYRKPDQKLKLSIFARKESDAVVYCVQDNGIGIDERSLHRIWDVFYRVDPSYSKDGIGVGLSIVAKIAEKHNGAVWVESTSGVGSSFFVRLPKAHFTPSR